MTKISKIKHYEFSSDLKKVELYAIKGRKFKYDNCQKKHNFMKRIKVQKK